MSVPGSSAQTPPEQVVFDDSDEPATAARAGAAPLADWVTEDALNFPDPGWRELSRAVLEGRASKPMLREFYLGYRLLHPFAAPPPPGWRLEQSSSVRRPTRFPHGSGEAPSITGSDWVNIGPTNVGGRVSAVAIHPGDRNLALIGAADGGVWKWVYDPVSGNSTWTALFETQPTLSVGAIALDPNDPNKVYVGTGEQNFSLDEYDGVGLIRSTDGGSSWLAPVSIDGAGRIGALQVSAFDSRVVFAATIRGLYRSGDSGANWTRVLGGGVATDVVLDPSDSQVIYAARQGSGSASGIFKSSDGGFNFTQLGGTLACQLPVLPSGVRIALAISKSSPATVYAALASGSGQVWKSTDAGATWCQMATPGSFCSSQCWYDIVLAVDPADPDHLLAGGVGLYRSRDGGNSWSTVSGVYVDHHALSFAASGATMALDGNDGGLYRLDLSGATPVVRNLEQGFVTAQYYGMGFDPLDSRYVYGGTQDNGSHRFTMPSTSINNVALRTCGDGGNIRVHPASANRIFHTVCPADGRLHFLASDDRGASATEVVTGITVSENANWAPPVEVFDETTMYTATADRVYRSDNADALPLSSISWSPMGSTDLTPTGGSITSIAATAADADTVWAATSSGRVWVTRDGGAGWTESWLARGGRTRYIGEVTASQSDADVAWIALGGYGTADSGGHIYETTDGGQSWTDLSGDLPNVPVNAIIPDNDSSDHFWAGTWLGLFKSEDHGASWVPHTAVPAVSVMDLVLDPVSESIYAATHGRGIWKLESPGCVPTPTASAGADAQFCAGGSSGIGGSPTASGGTPPYSYDWTPAAGLSSTTVANPTASPTATTTYTVRVTDAASCAADDSVVVTVNPAPAASAGPDRSFCSGASTAIGGSPTASAGTPPYTYSWSPAAGLSSTTVANPTASPAATTTYTVVVTDAKGCSASDAVVVTVNPVPAAAAGSDLALCLGDSDTIGGSPTATAGTPPYTYSWSPAAGLSSTTVANPTASPTATTTYTVVVTDAQGCSASDSVVVTVDPAPTASAGLDRDLCLGDSATIGGSPTASAGTPPYTYSWSPAAGLSSTTVANPTASPTITTTYTVVVTDAKGCSASDSVVVTVDPAPTASAGLDREFCSGGSDTIGGSPTASAGTPPYTYSWSPAAGLSSTTVANPTASPSVTTTYTVVVTDATGCSASDSVAVTINPAPAASAGSDLAICLGDSDTIGGSPTASAGTPPYTYSWSPAAGLSSTTVANPTASPTATTTYTVVVTDAKGCSASDSVVVTVNPLPAAAAGSDLALCLGDSATIGGSPTASAGTPPYTYSWSPAAGLSSTTVANPTASPTATTTYTVVITDANGCSASDAVVVTVDPDPTASAGLDRDFCSGGSDTIGGSPTASAGTPPYTYSWSPAAGLSSTTVANPTASSTATTTYTVVVTDAKGCSASDSVVVTVNPLPAAAAGSDFALCLGDSDIIGGSPTASAGTPPYTYSWSPAAGLSSTTVANPTASPTATTTYTVVVTDSKGCSASDVIVVTVDPLPAAAAGSDLAICLGDSDTIGGSPTASAGTPPYTYSWSPAAGLSSTTVANPTASPTVTTTYTVVVTDSKGCSASDVIVVTVNPLPAAAAGSDLALCLGDSDTIGGSPTASAGTPPYTYSWSPAAGLSSTTVANPTASPTATTTYTVVVTDAKGCSASDAVVVAVDPAPTATAGLDRDLCHGGSDTIGGSPTASAGTPPYTYSWSPAAGLSSTTVANPTASPTVTTSYTVVVTDSKGCSASDTLVVTVNPLPAAAAGSDLTLCLGDSAAIGGSPTALAGTPPYTYSWSPAAGLSSTTVANPTASPTVTTTYTVVVTDSKGCSASDVIVVTVDPAPTASAGLDREFCSGGSATIGGSPTASAGTPPYTYSWSPAAGLSSTTVANPTASPTATTTYTVVVTDANGCSTSDSVVVTVDPLPVVNAGSDAAICAGRSLVIGGRPTASAGTPPYTYYWAPATGLSSNVVANPIATPAITTTYTVLVSDARGCSVIDSVTITVNTLPSASAGTDATLCAGTSTTLGGSPTAAAGTPPYTYSWSPAAGLDSTTVANPIAAPAATTTYTVTVTDAAGCSTSDDVVVTVEPSVLTSAGPDVTVCAGVGTTIGGSPTAAAGRPPYSYSWSPATGLTSPVVANPVASPAVTTTYTVTVTDAAGCTASDQVVVTVAPKVVASAGPDPGTCLGSAVAIGGSPTATAGTAPYAYSWAPATGLSSAIVANPSAAPGVPTRYTVTVTDSMGCTASDAVIVTVNPLPIADASPDADLCLGDGVVIGGDPTAFEGTPPYTWSWAPALGLSSTSVANPTASPAATTTYTVTVLDDLGCTASDTVIVSVHERPLVSAGADATTCAGSPVAIGGNPTAASGAPPYTYLWSPAAGLDSTTVANPTASPAVTTTYSVIVTDSLGCAASGSVRLAVDPVPTADAGLDAAICAGGSVAIGGTPAAAGGTPPYRYSWAPAAGLSSTTVPDPIASPSVTTTYTLTVTDALGCVATASVDVTVDPDPAADAGADVEICPGGSTTIGATPTAAGGTPPYTYTWSPAAGLSSTSIANPTASPGSTTTYTVSVEDARGCTAVDAVTVTLSPALAASAGNDARLCAGASLDLGGSPTASGGTPPFSYSWSPATGLSSATDANPAATPSLSTLYTVTVLDARGCSASDSVQLTVDPAPVADAGPARSLCSGGSVAIGGTPTAAAGTPPFRYAWSPAAGLDSSSAANPTASPVVSTTYSVTVTDALGCEASRSVVVKLDAQPLAQAGPDRDIVPFASVPVGAPGQPGVQYRWIPCQDVSDCTAPQPLASPAATTTLTLTATDLFTRCSAEDSVLVNVCVAEPSFHDVPMSHPFWHHVEALRAARVTGGCAVGPPLYCPSAPVSREEMAVFILRALKVAPADPPVACFDDVPLTSPYAKWICEFAHRGISDGCSTRPRLFCPATPVTREQMALFLLRAMAVTPVEPSVPCFDDVDLDSPYAKWICELARRKISNGCSLSPPLYCPEESVSRGQMSALLTRAFDIPSVTDCFRVPPQEEFPEGSLHADPGEAPPTTAFGPH